MEKTATSKGKWYGKPLEEFGKDELIDIIICLAEDARKTIERNIKDRKTLAAIGVD